MLYRYLSSPGQRPYCAQGKKKYQHLRLVSSGTVIPDESAPEKKRKITEPIEARIDTQKPARIDKR